MDTLKTAVIVVLLLAVVYGAYVVLKQPETPLPQEIAWHEQKASEPLQIDMGTPSTLPSVAVEASAPATKVDVTSGDSTGGTPKPYIHGELSPEEPSTTLSEPPPIRPKADLQPPPADMAAGLPDALSLTRPAVQDASQEITRSSVSPGVAAPNLLASEQSASTQNEPAETSNLELPTLPTLRNVPDEKPSVNVAAAPPMPASAIPPSASDATSPPSPASSTDAILNSLLERDNVGPITAEDVAKDEAASSSESAKATAVYEAALKESQLSIDSGKFNQALFILSKFVSSPDLTAKQHAQLQDLADPLAAKVVYSTEHLIESAYEVRRGDKLSAIAEMYHVPWELLANINSIENPDLLIPGSKIKVVPGPFRAEINLQGNELTLFAGQLYAGRFPISIGVDPKPNPGEYRVMEKQIGRVYYAGDGRTIAADDPSNPYGRIWIGLGNDLCIHSSPQGTQTSASGCISLSPLDANDVYNILSQGSSVIIRR